ncbi:MAG: zinc-finger domain-containing protein [Pseudomonadota bacterium]|nr:zinc-finger domain-containing protein [Pseudomonadota bacterium]
MTLDAPETEIVAKSRVACDGSGPALGHPRVWLQIPADPGFVDCGYCDKRFILKGGPADPEK